MSTLSLPSRSLRTVEVDESDPNGLPICPLCASRDSEKCFRERGHWLRACNTCDLFFIDPYPKNTDRHECVTGFDFENVKLLDPRRSYLSQVQYYKRCFDQVAAECVQAGSLLDVGCGSGHLLERLAVFPLLHREGIGLNSPRSEFARQITGCPIHDVRLEDFRSERKFDVVTMMSVISRIPSPDLLFKSVRALLSSNGKLILRTSEMSREIKKWNVSDWEMPLHAHFLGLKTLDFICKKYGFKVLKHVRTAFSDDFFLASRWREPGRSRLRNTVKNTVANVPFALDFLHRIYDIIMGRRLFVSFIVLTPA